MTRQLEISLSLLLLILAGNVIFPTIYYLGTSYTPDPSYHLTYVFSRFLFLSFRKPGDESLYYKGRDDAYFIGFYFILFWFLRDASMRWLLEPLARRAGITRKRSIVRFAEQGWAFLYYSVFSTLGLYIMQTSPYKNLRTEHYYIGYPHDALPPLSKWYYLVQTAFWLQQIMVLNLEERRSDHQQMLTHHAVTVLLMSFSYVFNWTRVGNAVLCLMDFVDLLLPLAKLFVYTKRQKLADFTFAVFMLSWILTRHIAYNIVLYSVAFELPRLVPHGWHPREGYFNAVWSHAAFTALLAIQQIFSILWFKHVVKVAIQVLSGHPGTDTRSDAGDTEEDEDEIILIDDEKLGTGSGLDGMGMDLATTIAIAGSDEVRLERKKDR